MEEGAVSGSTAEVRNRDTEKIQDMLKETRKNLDDLSAALK